MGSISKLSQCFLKIPKYSESLMSLLSNECKTKENEHFPKKLGPIRRERVYSFLTLLFRQLPQNGNTKKHAVGREPRTVLSGQYRCLYGVRTGDCTAYKLLYISHWKVQEIQGNPCVVGVRLALASGVSGPALLGGGAVGRRQVPYNTITL